MTRHDWWPWAKTVLLLTFLGGVGVLIAHEAQTIAWAEVLNSLRAYPASVLALAASLAALSLALYSCYDLLGRRYCGHTLSTRTVLSVAFISYVFNLNLGALVGGIAFRLRLYARLGLSLGQISRVVGLSMLTNWLGYLVLAGGLFVLHPPALPSNWPLERRGVQLLGMGLLLAAAAYLLLCTWTRQRTLHLRGHHLKVPSARMAWLQAAMGLVHWLLLGSLMKVLMPHGPDFPTVMAVLLLAAVAGVLAHVPAGIGVLEAVFLALLSHQVPGHELLAALLAYRLIYYLVPLLLAVLLYLFTEADMFRAKAALASGKTEQPVAEPDC